MGWFFFYAGITKVLNPAWSAAQSLAGAETFRGLFAWFALPENIGWVSALNAWGLTLLGASLILGLGVRFSSVLGAVLMGLYYFMKLKFPYPTPYTYLVDDHIIYALALLSLAALRAGRVWGLETWCANLSICKKYPRLHAFWG